MEISIPSLPCNCIHSIFLRFLIYLNDLQGYLHTVSTSIRSPLAVMTYPSP